jgi:hypothetical protein
MAPSSFPGSFPFPREVKGKEPGNEDGMALEWSAETISMGL